MSPIPFIPPYPLLHPIRLPPNAKLGEEWNLSSRERVVSVEVQSLSSMRAAT